LQGNTEVLKVLVQSLDEERFRKLMSVAAANLVDNNVFIRSILLSLERISSSSSADDDGDTIGMRYGRLDVTSEEDGCPKEGNLPDSAPREMACMEDREAPQRRKTQHPKDIFE
jgi:hypothetical protein